MDDTSKRLLELQARRKKFELKRKPDDFVWFCINAFLVGFVLFVLCCFLLALVGRMRSANVIGEAGVNAAMLAIVLIMAAMFAVGTMLLAAFPVRTFIKFKDGGYQLSLKQLFVIAAIIAVLCAIVGYAVR